MSDGQRGQVKGKQLHSGGFQPFRPPMNPNPGKMEVVEVGRQGEPIFFDNEQEIITAPVVVKNNKNSFQQTDNGERPDPSKEEQAQHPQLQERI